MHSITMEKARKELSSIIAMTVRNRDETVIVSEKGSVVLVEEGEWESIKETLNLLNDEKSLSALLTGQSLRESGKTPEGKSVEEVFSDV